MKLDWPPIEVLQKECSELLHQVLRRGWTTDLIACAGIARFHATGVMPSCRELLQAICEGEFDFLFFDHGQSRS